MSEEPSRFNDLLPERPLTDSEVEQLRESGNFTRVEIITGSADAVDEIELVLSDGERKSLYFSPTGEWEVRTITDQANKILPIYCTQCEEFVETTVYGKCRQCSSAGVAKSLLESVPEDWKVSLRPPAGKTGYVHRYLDVTVGISMPDELFEEKSTGPAEEGIESEKYVATIQWPNHIPYGKEKIYPQQDIQTVDQAKDWTTQILMKLNDEYSPQDIQSIGKAFGGDVEAKTKDSPTVESDLECSTCGAYLPHYHGSRRKVWYEYHYKHIDGADHEDPEEYETSLQRKYESLADCPHCNNSINDPHRFIDHLVEHGHSRDEAFYINQRL